MGAGHELDAADITDPALRKAFLAARELHSRHGRSYFLATRLLPAGKRPYVHALYGFARFVDDVVDHRAPGRLPLSTVDCLLESDTEPVVVALRETMRRFELPMRYVEDFLASMRSDLTVAEYPRYPDLERYMWGSGAVIGLLLLPILGTRSRALAEPYAADLGIAFQLTNFIRDVGEDVARGRIYLPGEDLALFGVDADRLRRGVVDGPVRRLLAYEIARTREIYRCARPGIRLLDPASRPCIDAAYRLYAGILDEIERADYQIFDRRISVPTWRRATIAARALTHR